MNGAMGGFVFKSLSAFLILSSLLTLSCREHVKEPSVAGAFYPAEEKVLESMVDYLLARAEPVPVEGRLIALLSPHAGYQFSGGVAAWGFRNLKGMDIKTVILLGPSHHAEFKGASVYVRGSLRTPLGKIRIDEKKARSLIKESADVAINTEAFEKEHSLEVQLPFLQKVLKDARVVPVLIGAPTRESFEHLASRLYEMLSEDEKTVMVVSTDLSHYHDYEKAVSMDAKMLEALKSLSPAEADGLLRSGEGEMCGAAPVLYALEAAKRLGANNTVLYKYSNSGDVSPEKGRVVGYASMGIFKSPLTEADKAGLLTLAKKTIRDYVKTGKITSKTSDEPKLNAYGAVFVTIEKNGLLRGCIGHLQPIMPLYRSVEMNAAAACSKDFRFPPMTPEELDDMDVEVSVLSPFEPISDPMDIEIGRHGLFIVKDGRTGVLLPQVPVKQGWDKKTFLKEVSLKAGLSENAWKEGAKLFRFSAEILKDRT